MEITRMFLHRSERINELLRESPFDGTDAAILLEMNTKQVRKRTEGVWMNGIDIMMKIAVKKTEFVEFVGGLL